jgi:multidrug efflux system membrane fusion protein
MSNAWLLQGRQVYTVKKSLWLRYLIPLTVLALSGSGAWWLAVTKDAPQERHTDAAPLAVTAAHLRPCDYTIRIPSQGLVRARTESAIIPEVSGTIMEISPAFREGGFFEKGEVLVRIDTRDYDAAAVIAQSNVAQAERAAAEEEARAAQNLEDWKRLGRAGEPGPLVARVPQVAEAKAVLASAKAAHDRALRDRERCELKAPFAGCIAVKTADVGQYVSPGRELAQIFAIDTAEVALPLHSDYLAFLDLPDSYRGEESAIPGQAGPEVKLSAQWAGRPCEWTGRLVRSSGAVAVKNLQVHAIAQIDDPYRRRAPGLPPLKVGLWVEARITGKTIPNVFLIPQSALREGREVLIVDAEQRLRRRQVNVLWMESDAPHAVVVNDGLKEGELLCTVALSYAVEGAKAKAAIDESTIPKQRAAIASPLTGSPGEAREDRPVSSPPAAGKS